MSDKLTELSERVAILETQVGQIREIDKKLDDLLALRHKGAGAFWLASSLVGTGLIGFLAMCLDWIKHG